MNHLIRATLFAPYPRIFETTIGIFITSNPTCWDVLFKKKKKKTKRVILSLRRIVQKITTRNRKRKEKFDAVPKKRKKKRKETVKIRSKWDEQKVSLLVSSITSTLFSFSFLYILYLIFMSFFFLRYTTRSDSDFRGEGLHVAVKYIVKLFSHNLYSAWMWRFYKTIPYLNLGRPLSNVKQQFTTFSLDRASHFRPKMRRDKAPFVHKIKKGSL